MSDDDEDDARSAALGAWRAMEPREAAVLLAPLDVPWWIAGGWALDLFLGMTSRRHGDLDVGIPRRDACGVRRLLSTWDVREAKAGVLTPLEVGQSVPPEVHSLWCRPPGTELWTLELLLDEVEGETVDEDNSAHAASEGGDVWRYRRAPAIRRPLSTLIRRAANGMPYLAPEIQLLYKSKDRRDRDESDFDRIAPRLDPDARAWLLDALRATDSSHVWIQTLETMGLR